MNGTLKIVIPTAGWAKRVRPQTWSKPKPLISVAGKAAIDHLLDSFQTIPAGMKAEYTLILGQYLGEAQIPPHMQEHHPDLTVHYAVQSEMKGQSDAIWMGREFISGPTIVIYSDTLIETDFSFLEDEPNDAVAWVKPVPDPRRFGVAELDASGLVTRLIEKPATTENNLAVVGCYYFREGRDLIEAIAEQVRLGLTFRGEYFLVDAINLLLERGARMRTETVESWLDTGTIEATLETNRVMLASGRANKTRNEKQAGVEIVAPVFIHPTAKIANSVVGPYTSIGADCTLTDARVEDSILEPGVTVEAAALKGSFIGRQARVRGRSASAPALRLNIGDDSSVLDG